MHNSIGKAQIKKILHFQASSAKTNYWHKGVIATKNKNVHIFNTNNVLLQFEDLGHKILDH